MPILLFKRHITVASHQEFFNIYNSIRQTTDKEYQSRQFEGGFEFLAMSKIFKRNESFNLRSYQFSYKNIDAKMLSVELILFFSTYYNSKIKVYKNDHNQLKIGSFIVPHKNSFRLENNDIFIRYKSGVFPLKLEDVKEVHGIINNFWIYTEKDFFHFSCNPYTGKKFQVIPAIKNYTHEYQTDDYYYESNTPNRLKFLSRRRKGFLFFMI